MSDSSTNITNKKAIVGDDAKITKIQSPNTHVGIKATGTITISNNNFDPSDIVTITDSGSNDYDFEADVNFTVDPGTPATGYINVPSQPSPGDSVTLTVDSIPYTFIADTDFAIGVTTGDTIVNLQAAIQATPVLQDLVNVTQPA